MADYFSQGFSFTTNMPERKTSQEYEEVVQTTVGYETARAEIPHRGYLEWTKNNRSPERNSHPPPISCSNTKRSSATRRGEKCEKSYEQKPTAQPAQP